MQYVPDPPPSFSPPTYPSLHYARPDTDFRGKKNIERKKAQRDCRETQRKIGDYDDL